MDRRAAVIIAITLAVSTLAYGDDEAFEQYSMDISQQIAREQSERDRENEADSPIHGTLGSGTKRFTDHHYPNR